MLRYFPQVVNFGTTAVITKISLTGLGQNSLETLFGAVMTELTSNNVMDENSFREPNKV